MEKILLSTIWYWGNVVLKHWFLLMGLGAGVLVTPMAHASLFDDKETRKDIADLRVNYTATQQIIQSQNRRISELSDALAQANGQIEKLIQEVANLKIQQESGYGSVDQRLQSLEAESKK